MIGAETREAAETVLTLFKTCGLTVATAESCTGGLLAAALTSISGSSAVVERGFVTYTNVAKTQSLGVPHSLLNTHGAVSAEVAEAMADGALARSNADVAISITGIAGPGGATSEKPVGLVYFGLAREHMKTFTIERRFGNIGRDEIREASVNVALALLRQAAG
jgi:nicotinamide-nucleotide amidase